MRFDPSKYKPYKMYGKEVYYAISGAQEKKIIDARKQYDVENNSELPDDVTVEAYRATVNELKELHYVKSELGTTINKYELVLDESMQFEVNANEIDGLWYQG